MKKEASGCPRSFARWKVKSNVQKFLVQRVVAPPDFQGAGRKRWQTSNTEMTFMNRVPENHLVKFAADDNTEINTPKNPKRGVGLVTVILSACGPHARAAKLRRRAEGAPKSYPNTCMVQTSKPKSASLKTGIALVSPLDCSPNRFLLSQPSSLDTTI